MAEISRSERVTAKLMFDTVSGLCVRHSVIGNFINGEDYPSRKWGISRTTADELSQEMWQHVDGSGKLSGRLPKNYAQIAIFRTYRTGLREQVHKQGSAAIGFRYGKNSIITARLPLDWPELPEAERPSMEYVAMRIGQGALDASIGTEDAQNRFHHAEAGTALVEVVPLRIAGVSMLSEVMQKYPTAKLM